MQPSQHHYLAAMGIQVWLERNTQVSVEDSPPRQINTEQTVAPVQELDSSLNDRINKLKQQVSACEQCELSRSRSQTVFGCGDIQADWMIIGEAPGVDEDKQGEPFVGRAGQLLNAMLLAIGLKREQIFIANILKCRPPNNRDPKSEEISACAGFLRQQIELIQPKIILAVGRIAAQNLLNVETSIGKMRGQCYHYPDTQLPVIVTYHPAYLLRAPREKRKVWQDLKMAQQHYKASIELT